MSQWTEDSPSQAGTEGLLQFLVVDFSVGYVTAWQLVFLRESQRHSLMTLLLIFSRKTGAGGGGSLITAFLTKTYQPVHTSAHAVSFSSLIMDEFSVFQPKVNPFSCVFSPIPCSLHKDFALAIIPSLLCIIKFS